MAIYLNNAILAKLDIKRDDLDDKTLKASSKKIPTFLFTKHLTSTPATFEQDRKNLLDGHHHLGHFSINAHDPSRLMTSSKLRSKCPNQMPSAHTIQGQRHRKSAASTAKTRTASFTWQDIYSDLYGKMRTPSITSYHYFTFFRLRLVRH